MKLGFSSYCFKPLISRNAIDVVTMLRWIAEQGGEHLEIATVTYAPPVGQSGWALSDQPDLLQSFIDGSKETGVAISGMCIPSDFTSDDPALRQSQLVRAKREVEACARLGARHFRHDVTEWARKETSYAEFEALFPRMVELSAELADYAATLGVTTSVENHGFYMNGSERVLRLIEAVGRDNFRATLDVGNFLCVDEQPLVGTRRLAARASFVHLKDFYVRPKALNRGPGWIRTLLDQEICGSIIGYGDLPLESIAEVLRGVSYEGNVSLEFEGNEDVLFSCETGFRNMRRILAGQFS